MPCAGAVAPLGLPLLSPQTTARYAEAFGLGSYEEGEEFNLRGRAEHDHSGELHPVPERSDQLNKLWELSSALTWNDLVLGMEPMFERLAYVDFLGHTMDWVPAYRPHEGGQVWLAALQHTFQPRALFPNNPRLPSDSEHTMAYTGLQMASGAQGTSISIGYVGDSYIDFGLRGMFIPIFIIGLLFGLMYAFYLNRARYQILGFAFATAVMIQAYKFEVAALKLLGGMLTSFLVLALLMWLAERFLWQFAQRGDAPAPGPEQDQAPVWR
jgi:hypothetical protein